MRHIAPFVSGLMLAAALAIAQTVPATTLPAGFAELPHWPHGFYLEGDMAPKRNPKEAPKADILVWVPDGAKQIRAMMIVPNNSDSKHVAEHDAMRKVAAKHDMAIVYMRNYGTGVEQEQGEPDRTVMPKLFDFLAKELNIPEFRHAPWITFGKSSRGKYPFRMAWTWPERTIATIDYHAETPTWPAKDWAKLGDETILHVNANGDSEWGGTWFVHVRPSLLNYRAKTNWLPHQIVVRDVGHGDYPDDHKLHATLGREGMDKQFPTRVTSLDVWDYLSVFADKALTLRLPKDTFPTDGPLTLLKVDAEKGYVIDPFAVEDTFGIPRLPLSEGPNGYVAGDGAEPPVSGYLAMSPPKDFTVSEGVPVVKLELDKSPKEWLITDSLKFAMQADPMLELGHLQKLMPKPGDETTIDEKKLVFAPIAPKHVAPEGGIALNKGLRPPNGKITLLAYTVIDVPERTHVRVNAGYTAATRIQMVINGTPVRHKQVLDLAPGKYPMLVVLRMTANWGEIRPSLGAVSEEHLGLAKDMQAQADKAAAEHAEREKKRAAGQLPPVIQKASDVPAEQRKKMLWIADQEQANA